MKKGKLVVISGASGVGKSTVLSKVMKSREDLKFSVSATTRAPRPGEVDGVSYYFVTRERFEEMIAAGEFLEYSNHMSNFYGTPRGQALEKMEKGHVLLDIEPNGAGQVKRICRRPFSSSSCRLPWRSWSAGSGVGAIPLRTRSRSA